MSRMSHKHRAAVSRDRCFTGPVSELENRLAHGNICVHETCSCGAERLTNINGGASESSGWYMPAVEDDDEWFEGIPPRGGRSRREGGE